MNFSLSESSLGRHRSRQWTPIITQQIRLRHLYQIMAFNLLADRRGSFYFTLHLTSMSSPFYTSEKVSNINPKWSEVVLKEDNISPCSSSSCVVIRVWAHHSQHDSCEDSIILTWGVNFTGLAYLGNKIADIQPCYFKSNSVIFFINGGYFTSHYYIRTDLEKPVPFAANLNVLDTLKDKVIYREVAIKSNKNDIQPSYNLEKLRKLQELQLKIKTKKLEVQNMKEKINMLTCTGESYNLPSTSMKGQVMDTSHADNIRYAPQLLTMSSLNKMLHEKPTKFQKQEMVKVSKEIEVFKFRNHLLVQERDKRNVALRKLKDKLDRLVDENEERNSDLMENYHKLSKESEKLREYKRSLLHHKEMLSQVNSQLQHRRKQLLQELLSIYPIEKIGDDRYSILGVHLPNSDVLTECNDAGLSVALGYITHTLGMCATFLQVPLRYPMTHYGSRSTITDQVSLSLPDKERELPLYTRGKEKSQFSYAVYLLNKNLAQLRWLFLMNTSDLRATLPNLLSFLNGPKDQQQSSKTADVTTSSPNRNVSIAGAANSNEVVSLSSLRINSNVSDTVSENSIGKQDFGGKSGGLFGSPNTRRNNRTINRECGKGLSEILAIPEAYLNKQISKDSFKNYICTERRFDIQIKRGLEETTTQKLNTGEPIEQGTDPLDVTSIVSHSIQIHPDQHYQHLRLCTEENALKHEARISRSVGSCFDDDQTLLQQRQVTFELGSEPILNVSCNTDDASITNKTNEDHDFAIKTNIDCGTASESNFKIGNCNGQRELFLESWLDQTNSPCLSSSRDSNNSDNFICDKELLRRQKSSSHPLTERTDKLITTKSFNLVKPKLHEN